MKYGIRLVGALAVKSPPARGAWIEIIRGGRRRWSPLRRPPHGGRGLKCCGNRILACALHCRPPHGGRGLKFMIGYMQPETDEVAPRTGGVD